MTKARELSELGDVLTVDGSGNVSLNGTVSGRDIAADGTKLDGIEAGATADQTITAGSGLSGGGTGDVTLSHADTSSQASVDNSGATVIQDVTLDDYGHVTGLASKTLTAADVGAQPAGTYNTIIGTDSDINTSGSTIIDNIYVTDGVITSMGTRTLAASDIGAITSIPSSAGAVGTYALMQRKSGTGTLSQGSTIAGSSIAYANVNWSTNFTGYATGTWRVMGVFVGSGTGSTNYITVCMRIS